MFCRRTAADILALTTKCLDSSPSLLDAVLVEAWRLCSLDISPPSANPPDDWPLCTSATALLLHACPTLLTATSLYVCMVMATACLGVFLCYYMAQKNIVVMLRLFIRRLLKSRQTLILIILMILHVTVPFETTLISCCHRTTLFGKKSSQMDVKLE